MVLFVALVLIALYSKSQFIRGYLGDFLVVVMLYTFAQGVLKTKVKPVALSVFGFAIIIETLQLLNLPKMMGLESSSIAQAILGSTFDWGDMLMYSLAVVAIIFTERKVTDLLS